MTERLTDPARIRALLHRLPSHVTRDYTGWAPDCDAMACDFGWSQTLHYTDWPAFLREFGGPDDDELNCVVDYYFDCDGDAFGAPGEDDPTRMSLHLWMTHPRKGASKGIEVAAIEEHEVEEVRAWLRPHLDIIRKKWRWVATGRKP